jgi:hypothetical protein
MADTPLYIPYFRENNLWLDYRKDIRGNSFTWAWERPTTAVRFLAVHHSVTKVRSTWTGEAGAKKYADEIANIHIDVRGWGGVGYHMIVMPDGYLAYVGDVSTARANIKDHNEKVIGICMIGDFTKHLPTDAQITSMHNLTWWFDAQRSTWPNLEPTWDGMVQGHKVLNEVFGLGATACPGSSYPVDMKWRIKTNTVYTPQPTPPDPTDPEPPTDPTEPPVDPTPPDNCCEVLSTRIDLLELEINRLKRATLWDWVKGNPTHEEWLAGLADERKAR